MEKSRAWANISLWMGRFMMANGPKMINKDRESYDTQMEMSILGRGKAAKGAESTPPMNMSMEIFTLESGDMTRRMASANSKCSAETDMKGKKSNHSFIIKESDKMEENTEWAHMNMPMVIRMRAILLTAREREKAFILGQIKAITREIGRETKCMATPYLSIQMDRPSKECLKMTNLFKKA